MWSRLLLLCLATVSAVKVEDLFPYGNGAGDKSLSRFEEDTSSPEVQLKTPVVFYGRSYDSIFVNENGLLTFSTNVPTFFNIQFPLDYPTVAPFYSDVDLRKAGNVWYRATEDANIIQRASGYVRRHFLSSRNFVATSIFLATWDKVGYFENGANLSNTFQVALITDGSHSYALLMYFDSGLQWIQGTGKSGGHPDAKAQAGFVSGDGRFHLLKGSGTDQISNLDKWSNVGTPGLWIFQLSNLTPEQKIGMPDLNIGDVTLLDPSTADSCAIGGTLCHPKGACVDYNPGFCCQCSSGYYGNGNTCLQEGAAQRVNGQVTGTLNGKQLDDYDLHSYVVVSDGRAYTAISKVPDNLGSDLQVLVALGSPVSWIFSKPRGQAKSGFQLTGGKLNYTSTISFPESKHQITVVHQFLGMDVFNYLELRVHIDGTIPALPVGTKVEVPNHEEEFTSPTQGILKSYTRRNYKLEGLTPEHPFTVETMISFDDCDWSRNRTASHQLKVSRNFIVYDAREKILRFAATSKVALMGASEDPCTKGSEVCTGNSYCVSEEDTFKCLCRAGFEFLYEDTSSGQSVNCVDVNECDTGRDQCSEHAQCINEPGTHRCVCKPGYHGDGHKCHRDLSCDSTRCRANSVCVEESVGQPICQCQPGYRKEGGECILPPPDEDYVPNCLTTNVCNENAVCKYLKETDKVQCVCNSGFSGDGYVCVPDSENCHVAEYCSPYASCEFEPTNATYYCKCAAGFEGDGYECKQVEPSSTPEPTCLLGVCWCEGEYSYDGDKCVGDSQKGEKVSEGTETELEQGLSFVSCNIVNNCHPRAQCVFSSERSAYTCRCNAGYTGDGYRCSLTDREEKRSCDESPEMCDANATCMYDDESLSSSCVCNEGYKGSGAICSRTDSCSSLDDCDVNASCKYSEVEEKYSCHCNPGYTGDGLLCKESEEEVYRELNPGLSVLEVSTDDPPAYNEIFDDFPHPPSPDRQSDVNCAIFNNCHRHATCQQDRITNTSRCVCLHGYSGDGLSCDSIRPGCHVINDCGKNAQCLYDAYSFTYNCQCNEGYQGDGFSCASLLTCEDDPSVCDRNAGCRIQPGVASTCVCRQGFVGDGFSCKAVKKHDGDFLLVAQGMSLLRIPFKPSPSNLGRPIQVQPFQTAIGVTIDCTEGKVYWGDVAGNSIKRSNYDGSHREPFFQHTAGAPEGIAIDYLSRVIYWVDSRAATINAASLDTKTRRTIINTNLANPRGIAVHPLRGKLFWSDWYREEPKIEVSNLDGSDRSVFVRDGLSLPNSLTIDEEREELCWTDAGMSKIECIGIDGTSRRSISSTARYPFGITNHQGQIYWTDWDEKKILVADKSTGLLSGSITVPFGGHGKLYGVAAVPETCHTEKGACLTENGGCTESQLCVTHSDYGRTCL